MSSAVSKLTDAQAEALRTGLFGDFDGAREPVAVRQADPAMEARIRKLGLHHQVNNLVAS